MILAAVLVGVTVCVCCGVVCVFVRLCEGGTDTSIQAQAQAQTQTQTQAQARAHRHPLVN